MEHTRKQWDKEDVSVHTGITNRRDRLLWLLLSHTLEKFLCWWKENTAKDGRNWNTGGRSLIVSDTPGIRRRGDCLKVAGVGEPHQITFATEGKRERDREREGEWIKEWENRSSMVGLI